MISRRPPHHKTWLEFYKRDLAPMLAGHPDALEYMFIDKTTPAAPKEYKGRIDDVRAHCFEELFKEVQDITAIAERESESPHPSISFIKYRLQKLTRP